MCYESKKSALQNDLKKCENQSVSRFIIIPHGEIIAGKMEKALEPRHETDEINSRETKELRFKLNNEQNYDTLTKEQLILLCSDKDVVIETCVKSLKEKSNKMLGKKDIMELYACESNKALRILKLMFQMGYGNKIGKEYYVSQKGHEEFVKDMIGKEVYI